MYTVLLIEDDDLLREGIALLLQAEGIKVLEAENLLGASKLLLTEYPDVMVVDGALPDGNGIEWISELRAKGNDMEIVFVSNQFSERAWVEKLRRLRVHSRLDKGTTTIRQIAAEVQRVLPGPPAFGS